MSDVPPEISTEEMRTLTDQTGVRFVQLDLDKYGTKLGILCVALDAEDDTPLAYTVVIGHCSREGLEIIFREKPWSQGDRE